MGCTVNVQKVVAESYLDLARPTDAQPTIDDVIAHAGVTELEFGTYFSSLEQVSLVALEEMLWMLQGSNMPRRLDEGNPGPDAAHAICDDIVARVSEAWGPVTVGIRLHRTAVQYAVGRAIQLRAAAYFEAHPGFRRMESTYLDSSAQYVGHGLAAIVAGWVAGELTSDASAVASDMSRLLPAWLVDPRSITEGAN